MNASIRSQLALSVATPVDKPYLSLISTALIFLLPGKRKSLVLSRSLIVISKLLIWIAGTPIIYAGSELGWAPSGDIPLQNVLPIGNHRSLGNYYGFLPMPWDIRGAGFSGNKSITASFQEYLRTLHVNETVEVSGCSYASSPMILLTHFSALINLCRFVPSGSNGSWSWWKHLHSDKISYRPSGENTKSSMGWSRCRVTNTSRKLIIYSSSSSWAYDEALKFIWFLL